ncbi:MAG: L,D-transpeptidase family protein [Paracoccaceae bacterium]
MRFLRILLLVVAACGLTACGNSKFKRYNGPAVTLVEVHKSDRKMYLLHDNQVLKVYDIGLGFQPFGHKEFEGDGKTPEGRYFISHRNPDSRYHLSLGISYPNPYDAAFAQSQGKMPGGDIMIHGAPPKGKLATSRDWTAGCIAVTDDEIERIYSMVKPGTPINIFP